MGIPGYRVRVQIGWRILWQTVGSYLVLLFLANLALLSWLPELTRTGPSVWALLIPLLAVTVLVAFLIMPAVVRALLTRSFGGVRLEAVREGTTPAPTEPVMTTRRSENETLLHHRDGSGDLHHESYGRVRRSSPGR